MKTCSCCRSGKPLSDFYKDARRKDGVSPTCKTCHAVRVKRWAANNPEKRAAISREWGMENKESKNKASAKWRAANRATFLKAQSRWRDENRDHARNYQVERSPARNAQEGRRRASKLQATPSWANHFFIEEAYHLAKLRERLLGGKWHVDHIVPLQGKTVCGLHVENNLQVIPAVQNLRKHNRVWPGMP